MTAQDSKHTEATTVPKSQGFLWSPSDWALLAGLLCLTPLLSVQVSHLWSRQHLQFFPLSWLAFVMFAVTRGELRFSESLFRLIFGLLLMLFAIPLMVMSNITFSPWFAHLAAITIVLGWMIRRCGTVAWTTVLAWTTLLLVTLPLPLNLDDKLIQELQLVSSKSASRLLDMWGTNHLLLGNVVEVQKGKLFVDQACSGVDSLYALMCATLVIVIYRKLSFVNAMAILCSVPFWAWFGNVLRLFILTSLYDSSGIDLVKGWQHTLLGLFTFSLVLLCLSATDRAITGFFKSVPNRQHIASWAHNLYNAIVRWPRESMITEPATSTETTTSNTPPLIKQF